jgi:hypothetical protein
MRRIPFRYIFPGVSFALTALVMFLANWQPTIHSERGAVGWDTSMVDHASPPLTMEFLTAMDLPAIVAVGPALISGQYLIEIYPAYGAFSVRL